MLQAILKALKKRYEALKPKSKKPVSKLSRKNATKRPNKPNTLARKLTRKMTRKKTLSRRKSTKKQAPPVEYANMDALYC